MKRIEKAGEQSPDQKTPDTQSPEATQTQAAAAEKPEKPKGGKKRTPADKATVKPKDAAKGSKKVTPPAKTVDIGALIDKRLEQLLSKTEERVKVPLIFSSIRNVMRAIQPLAKTHEHPDQGFDFRRIDEICARIQPLLVEHGIFYVQHKVLSVEQVERPVIAADGSKWVNIFTRVTVQWRLYAMDGSYLECESAGEAMSEQHFSTPAAQTMAEKTMLCDTFCIPVYGEQDPEEITGERSQPTGPKEIYVTPAATTASSSAPTNAPTLFDVEVPEPADDKKKKRRGKKDEEPQTAVAGALDQASPESDKPISPGFVSILLTQMKPKNITEAAICKQFGLDAPVAGAKPGESLFKLRTSKMGEASAWIQAQKAE